MEFEEALPRQAPVHGRQVIKASLDENYLTLTLTLKISLKRRLFDFCFFIYKKTYVLSCLSLYLVLYKKEIKGSFVKNIRVKSED
jgi:hypothetical protein